MKLFVKNEYTNEKEYLNVVTTSKSELKRIAGSNEIKVNGHLYDIENVEAEIDSESAAPSMVIGGAIGLLGGVPGVIAGGIIGGLLGNNSDIKEKAAVQRFNESALDE